MIGLWIGEKGGRESPDQGVIMTGRWKELVTLAFKGRRFEGHALDLSALAELSHFQGMVAATAKELWRSAHPDRERLPSHFDVRTRLCLRRIEEGSAVAPLEVFIEEDEQQTLFDPEPTEAEEAIALAHEVYRAVEADRPLPKKFPKHLVSEYERWGQNLREDEAIEFVLAGKKPVRVTPSSHVRLARFGETSHQDQVNVVGEVLEADLKKGRFQVWLDEKTGVTVAFSSQQEGEVTNALRDHRTLRLRVIGRGEFSAQGKLLHIPQVERLQLQPLGESGYDATARPIEDVLMDLADEVPEEDWKRLPPDLTDNLDHYLYGTPRQ